MKNPNGYGSVYKLSGKRRKPFGARVTVGWSKDNKQLYKNIGYYESRQLAMIALADYNKNPYSLESNITFKELFDKWSDEKFNKISKSNANGYTMAFKMSESMHDIKFAEIKKAHMQSVIDGTDKGHGTKRKIKVLYNQLYKFALENDIVTKDYSKFVELGENTEESTREVFSKDEIQLLWDNVGRMDFIDSVLIMIYTGLRPGELVLIKNEDINLNERYMRGGIKTKAGKNRVIPINKKIHKFIEDRFNQGNEFLVVNYKNEQMRYFNFYEEKWKKIMEQLNMNHKPHDCRHTFASLMDSAGANKLCIKRIMGHSSTDITDKVYTHKDINELIENVDLI